MAGPLVALVDDKNWLFTKRALRMKNTMAFIQKNIFLVGISFIVMLILTATLLGWYNKQEMLSTTVTKERGEEVKRRLTDVFSEYITKMDLGLRGYALTQNEQMLVPYNSSVQGGKKNMAKIDSLLKLQGLDTSLVAFAKIKAGIDTYTAHCDYMKDLAQKDSTEEFLALMKLDKGYDLWKLFAPFFNSHMAYEDQVIRQAQTEYEAAMSHNLVVLTLLTLIGLPVLFFLARQLSREARQRQLLVKELEDNNRKYLYDPGTLSQHKNHQQVIEESIGNFKKASALVKAIAAGDYDANWQGLDEKNKPVNQETLAGELVKMRERMKQAKLEDDRRNWTNEGLTRFSEMIRNNQNDLEKLSAEAVRFLTKYLNAQQGSLFVLEDATGDPYLQLTACYAFDRKKFVEQKIAIGTGLVGQAYLEGDIIILTEIPQGYTTITSGLGDATPSCLVIVPMKYNEQVEAIIELASFERFEEYQLRFLEKAGEFVASTILTARTAEKTQHLLRESQTQSEILKAQEEEMRQNMEEMAATQEEMSRRQEEAYQLKVQMEQLLEVTQVKERSLQAIIDNTDDVILAFDTHYRILAFNERYRQGIQKTGRNVVLGDDVLEKNDRIFSTEQQELIKSRYDRMLAGDKYSAEDTFQLGGITVSYQTNYMPLYNLSGQIIGGAILMRQLGDAVSA
jgi:CHASE3 domain sensor protein/PAS domain-containing protein